MSDHVLVRSKRYNNKPVIVKLGLREEFDLTDFRFLCFNERGFEEWVHKDELDIYKRSRQQITVK